MSVFIAGQSCVILVCVSMQNREGLSQREEMQTWQWPDGA